MCIRDRSYYAAVGLAAIAPNGALTFVWDLHEGIAVTRLLLNMWNSATTPRGGFSNGPLWF